MSQVASTAVTAAQDSGGPADDSPFHAGEQAVQALAGVRQRAERGGRHMIRDFMPDQHRELFAKLPFLVVGGLVVGGLDGEQRVWASILAGRPGFVGSPDPRSLSIAALPLPGDPLAGSLSPGVPIGLLGIELPTRRRNRMNGTVTGRDGEGLAVRVRQSFGNCPQYIQARDVELWTAAAPQAGPVEGAVLSRRAAALVRRADTFFIATASAAPRGGAAADGVDVSHRGGKPGFVHVAEDESVTVLTSPDFPGNSLFNTLGNLAVNPRAGLLFVDFETGDALLLTGDATVIWDGPALASFAGAKRLLRFATRQGRWIERALPLRWSAPEQAPQLASTGSWDEVRAALPAASEHVGPEPEAEPDDAGRRDRQRGTGQELP